jgi:cyclase
MNSKTVRVIARLDVKGQNLIKGINLEGLRIIGDPNDFALKYYNENADEILYIDPVASLYGRSKLTDIIKKSCKNIFIPITVGGGIKNLQDVEDLLKSGADKVAINTGIVNNNSLIKDIAKRFGSQCIVGSIEAKLICENNWEVYTDSGRERTNIDAIAWSKKIEDLGVGEILITSIDKEGTGKGFDIQLIENIVNSTTVPIIASGGFGSLNHLNIIEKIPGLDALAFADSIHYSKISLYEIKEQINKNYATTRI